MIRNRIFWFIDSLKGGAVSKHFLDIKKLLDSGDKTYALVKTTSYLNDLLIHAIKTVPFYERRMLTTALNEFPVVNKNIIRDSYDSFLSKNYRTKDLFSVTTSGSTGTPFKVYQDKTKRVRHIADNIYYNYHAGVPLGMRLFYFRIWNVLNKKSSLKFRIQNIVPQDASLLTDHTFELFLKKVTESNGTSAILAYASTFEALGRYVEKRQFSIENRVASIVSMSETLPLRTKEQLSSAFKCPVVSRYSNMENGFIAQQCISDGNEYHLNVASYHIEILDMLEDRLALSGSMGRIVVTDYFNYAMPLIRYDTGDIGIMVENSKCGLKNPVLSHIEGRRVDFINDTSGRLLSPHVITNTLWKYDDVVQFQFIQRTRNEYTIKLNIGSEDKYCREEYLIDDLKFYLGSDARIYVEYVSEIPALASGKRKKIINMGQLL